MNIIHIAHIFGFLITGLPLSLSARRDGSSCFAISTNFAAVSCRPCPSLKITHMMIEGAFQCVVMISLSCFSYDGLINGLRMVGVRVRRGHVLPHEQTHFIRPVVPAGGFHFNMLAHHVEAEGLHGLQYRLSARLRWAVCRCRPARNPDPKRTKLEDEFVVEQHLLVAPNLPDARFYAYRSSLLTLSCLRFAVCHEHHVQVIQEGTVRRPQTSICNGNRQRQFSISRATVTVCIDADPLP